MLIGGNRSGILTRESLTNYYELFLDLTFYQIFRIDLLNGLSIKLNLTADAQVLYGLNGSNYEYEVSNVFLMGDYLVSAKPVKESAPAYVSYQTYQSALHSGNDHMSVHLALSAVNSIYHNFQPSAWSNNYNFNSFCTPPLLQKSGDDYVVAISTDIQSIEVPSDTLSCMLLMRLTKTREVHTRPPDPESI